jgi:hypothetical protein
MKKFILNFALLFLAGSSFSANEIRSKQIEDIYSCTQMTVTLGCGAQYEYCMGEGMLGVNCLLEHICLYEQHIL